MAAGNDLYQNSKYDEALIEYLKLEETFVSFDLFYNLGNTYYKLNKTPESILYYEKAKKIDPSDEDLSINIQIANLKVIDKIDKLPSLAITDLKNKFLTSKNLNTWAWVSIISLFICLGLFYWYIRNKTAKKSRASLIIGILFAFITITAFSIGQFGKSKLNSQQEAIIFSSKVDVLNQPNGTITVFVLHAGTKVQIRNIQTGWKEIKIDNGSIGWIKDADSRDI